MSHKGKYVPQLLRLGAECEDGNVEYKRQLICTEERFRRLVSQMKYRLSEGQGEAVYYLGVEDDGKPVGLPPAELHETLSTFSRMVNTLNCAIISKVFQPGLGSGRYVGRCGTGTNRKRSTKTVKVVIQEKSQGVLPKEVRAIVLGGAHTGKSTIIASIVTGDSDDGSGLARMHVLKHKHEVDNGHTSCVSTHSLSFDGNGDAVLQVEEEMPTAVFFNGATEISAEMSQIEKVVSLVDVAGSPRYAKTVWKGLTAYKPSFALVTFSGMDLVRAGPSLHSGAQTSQDPSLTEALACSLSHFLAARALELPVILVVTKVDVTAQEGVTDETLIASVSQRLSAHGVSKNQLIVDPSQPVKPPSVALFLTSSVNSLRGIDQLRSYVGLVCEPQEVVEGVGADENGACLHLREYFNVGGVGVVGGGVCEYGTLQEGDVVCIGPDRKSKFVEVVVSSIRSEQGLRTKCVSANQTACLAFDLPSIYHSGASAYSSCTSDDEDIENVFRRGACIFNLYSGLRTVVVVDFKVGVITIIDSLSPWTLDKDERASAVGAEAEAEDTDTDTDTEKSRGGSGPRGRTRTQIQKNAHFVVHSNAVRQSAVVTQVQGEGRVLGLRFVKRGECLVAKAKVILSNGSTVVIGQIS